jgi:heme oxygenase (biliverdin-IX-beta and delta-forming)
MGQRSASLLDGLRVATRARHAALDASLRLGSVSHYLEFVQASHAALEQLEPAIAARLPEALRVRFCTGRVAALAADLATLGAAPRPALPPPLLIGEDAALGAAYVLEGSSLGGVVIAARVERDLQVRATSYLRLHGRDTGARWAAFAAQLALHPQSAQAEAAACAVFDHYLCAFRISGALARPLEDATSTP